MGVLLSEAENAEGVRPGWCGHVLGRNDFDLLLAAFIWPCALMSAPSFLGISSVRGAYNSPELWGTEH